ncbi:MAG: DUF4304 domain-containing protein [Chloroflexi bacterium]|nr:DUF4304 domain-containing protein [Chloroflexota bacterium]
MTAVAPVLKRAGFRKQRQLFTRYEDGNIGVVQFQKSASATQDRVTFTTNLGVWSVLVSASEGRRRTAALVTEPDCHWRARIWTLLPARQDRWWEITPETDIDVLAAEIRAILEQVAIPTVVARTPDTGLRDHWLAGGSAGTTEFCRLTSLTTWFGRWALKKRTTASSRHCATSRRRELNGWLPSVRSWRARSRNWPHTYGSSDEPRVSRTAPGCARARRGARTRRGRGGPVPAPSARRW